MRIRSAARSLSERSHVWRTSSSRVSSVGTVDCQCSSDASASRRSACRARANASRASGWSPFRSGCTPTCSVQLSPYSSDSWKRTTLPSTVQGCENSTIVRAGKRSSARITTRRAASQAGGRGSGRCTDAGLPNSGSRSLTVKMSAKSASISSVSSVSTRRRAWHSTVMRSCMQSPTKRSRSIESSFG